MIQDAINTLAELIENSSELCKIEIMGKKSFRVHSTEMESETSTHWKEFKTATEMLEWLEDQSWLPF